MKTPEEQRRALTCTLAIIEERLKPLLARYAPIVSDRSRRAAIERELRAFEKPLVAHALATMKLGMVREELAGPMPGPIEPHTEQEARDLEYAAARRRILHEEENRLCRQLGALAPTMEAVKALQTGLLGLLPEDPQLEHDVEEAQQEHNIVRQELRHVEAEIALGKGGAS